MNYYSPITELDYLTKDTARYPFRAETRDEAVKWQQAARQALAEIVGFVDDSEPVTPEAKVLDEMDRGDYVLRKIELTTSPAAKMPVYILQPKTDSPLPAVLAYHGHGPGVRMFVGLDEDGNLLDGDPDYHKLFAVELCKRGFVVAAPEIACFGERQEIHSGLGEGRQAPTTCHQAATYAIMLGKSVLGMRVRDSMRLADYLKTLPEIDANRVGAMGISGGGMLAFFHAALDWRIKAVVLSGYFGNFRDNILALHHCTCNFIPGLLQIGEMEDLVGLLAPRPLLVEAGERDPIFPIESVRACYQRTQEIYKVFGTDPGDKLQLDAFPGGHEISGRVSYDFLARHLA
jgi:dienelactone hydrolase